MKIEVTEFTIEKVPLITRSKTKYDDKVCDVCHEKYGSLWHRRYHLALKLMQRNAEDLEHELRMAFKIVQAPGSVNDPSEDAKMCKHCGVRKRNHKQSLEWKCGTHLPGAQYTHFEAA